MVGAPRWEQWCVNVAAALVMTGELRTFDRDSLAAAWQWVRA
ncbi:SpoIIAA family protein [Mycobacterium simulans]|nr:STAS/SEC14 domain-containing protein [Mycobacterium simulans]